MKDHDLSLIMQALKFSAEAHLHQRRKDEKQSPYIVHPISVAELLVNTGGITDAEAVCAALLHDTIEDCGIEECQLQERFGTRVAELVRELTTPSDLRGNGKHRHQVRMAATMSPMARVIKLCDKICNLHDVCERPPKDWSVGKKQDYFRKAAEVVGAMGDVNRRLQDLFTRTMAREPAA